MVRRNFFKSAAIIGISSSLLTSCSSAPTQSESSYSYPSGTIIHSVYFWLEENISQNEEMDFLNFFEALKKIPGIQTFQFGKPANTTPRAVVDNSFSYNLIITFKNIEDINVYADHPDHLAAVNKYDKYWTKVQVMDTII